MAVASRRKKLDAALKKCGCVRADEWVLRQEVNTFLCTGGVQSDGRGKSAQFGNDAWLAQWAHLYTKVKSPLSGHLMVDIKTPQQYREHFSKKNMDSDLEWLIQDKKDGGCGLDPNDNQVLIAKFLIKFRKDFAAGVLCSYSQMSLGLGLVREGRGQAMSKRALAVQFLNKKRCYHIPLMSVLADKARWHRDDKFESQLHEAAGVPADSETMEWLDFSGSTARPGRAPQPRWHNRPLQSAADLTDESDKPDTGPPSKRRKVATASDDDEATNREPPSTIEIGTRVRKKYPQYGVYDGEVISFADGKGTVHWDNDQSESKISLAKLLKLVQPGPALVGSTGAMGLPEPHMAAASVTAARTPASRGPPFHARRQGAVLPTASASVRSQVALRRAGPASRGASIKVEVASELQEGGGGCTGRQECALNVEEPPSKGTAHTPLKYETEQAFKQKCTKTPQASSIISDVANDEEWRVDGPAAVIGSTRRAQHERALQAMCKDDDNWGQTDTGQVIIGLINDTSDPAKKASGQWSDARGLFAAKEVPPGKLMLRYVGEYKTIKEYNHQVNIDPLHEDQYLYTADFNDSLDSLSNLTVDATSIRGVARNINDYRTNIDIGDFSTPALQARQANVEFVQVIHKKDVHIAVYNHEALHKGDQLLVDYGDSFWEEWHGLQCRMAVIRQAFDEQRARLIQQGEYQHQIKVERERAK
jgi:hypothetical protein